MSRFAIRNPYFIVVVCLIIGVVGLTTLLPMPVDMFPSMDSPVVLCATFYSGMPPEQIETDITSRFERFVTGLSVSGLSTGSVLPAAFLLAYGKRPFLQEAT